MSAIVFSKNGYVSWSPSVGRNWPATPEIRSYDVSSRTEAGTARIANYGTTLIHRFDFEDLPRADWDGGFNWSTMTQAEGTMSLAGWFYGPADRQANEFSFADEGGTSHTSRFTSADLAPSDLDNRYVNVSFALEEQR